MQPENYTMDISEYFWVQRGQPLLTLLQKLPLAGDVPVPPAIHLLERRQQEQRINTALQTERADNEQKRHHGERRVAKERQIINRREETLKVLQEERDKLTKRKVKIQEQVQKYSKYYHYLQRVLEATEEFQQIWDILCRYYTLVDTSRYIEQARQEVQEATQQVRGHLSHHLEEINNSILQHNNEMDQLQRSLEEAQNRRLQAESRWAHIQNTAAKKTLLLGTIKLGTLNLYQTLRGQHKDSGNMEDTEAQLAVIQQYKCHQSDIYNEVSRRHPQPRGGRPGLR
ncbi:coiled-coil domain-containing protein 42-like isoform X2 [Hyperolius riggenbachi]|uniref:coiled-coil domain-containing protein 42-like isoform X2 n=1 Tax=Hyperolius riggenbachi TaxID=752182 RepID=UPI0035A3732B